MPLVAFTPLPTFNRLRQENHDVLSLDKATHQDIRELHVGLLNMMPDASLQATERQFLRLLGDSNQIVQIYVHLFTLPSISRDIKTQVWIDEYYESFNSIKSNGLDALIISGATPYSDDLEKEVFWPELTEVIDWANINVTSTLCACLASHAVIQYCYGVKRKKLESKKWGVYEHRLSKIVHPLTRHINSRFDIPHSRYNQVSSHQLISAQVIPLIQSDQAGFHLAVSPDGFRLVFFQGHPEYDACSLLKEYKREIGCWKNGTRVDYPPFPENYFSNKVKQILNEYRSKLELHQSADWPEAYLMQNVDNTWRDTTLSIFSNWLGLVYQLTNEDIKLAFMSGVDPDDPLASL
jgi:homoserine O-succinyltransferase/O-acetyltransferase